MIVEPLLDRASSRALDTALVAAGVGSVILMENAGRGAADAIREVCAGSAIRRAVVFAGPGNNGGDGYVVARQLVRTGWEVVVASSVDPAGLRGDAATMRDAWRAAGRSIAFPHTTVDGRLLGDFLRADSVVVDALFGTGLARPLEGAALEIIRRCRAGDAALRFALDVPSGVDADTGDALGGEDNVFPAEHTLTFGTSKPGLHTGIGARMAGTVHVVHLGVPIAPSPTAVLVLDARVSRRRSDTHKGDHGRVIIVGGSAGTTGAALLAARGAHRAGAGLVTVAARDPSALVGRLGETMTFALEGDRATLAAALARRLGNACGVVGPGMGLDAWARDVLDAALDSASPLVLDADALTILGERGSLDRPGTRVLTPHPLELARLLGGGVDAPAVQRDRIAAARAAAERYRSIVVLKGAGTIVVGTGEKPAIIPVNEPALGVGGSGDVLAGVIAARIAEATATSTFAAVVEGVWAHAHAGRALALRTGVSRGALASEIADEVPRVLEQGPPQNRTSARGGYPPV